MAFINNEWVDAQTRDDTIKQLKERLAMYMAAYQAGKLTDEMQADMRAIGEELKRLERIKRAQNDVAYFAFHYLSDMFNEENEDNAIKHTSYKQHDAMEHMAPIHREFYSLCDYINEKPGARVSICSARGHSKSTIFSGVLPLHALCFRNRKYIMIISETDTLAKQLLSWIRNQLKFNKRLREDFGELLHTASNKNEKDNEDVFITTNNVMVQASSTGKQLRGAKHGSTRVDMAIIDDPSSMANEGSPEAREKLIAWFNTVVMPMGSPDARYVVCGTMVSKDGLLNHVLKRKDFRSSYHGAVLQFPTNPALWDEYMVLYSKVDGEEEADAYYQKNQYDMEEGIQLAWPWRWSYRNLMHEKHAIGSRAFSSEYLNKSFSEEDQVFKVDTFAFYTATVISGRKAVIYDGQTYYVDDMYISGAWDPAMGANARACLNSFVTVGKDRKSGFIFVLDDMSRQEQAHVFIHDVVAKIHEYNHDKVIVEGVNAYSEFERQLRELLRVNQLYKSRVELIKTHKTSKQQRIDSLEPLCHNRTLVFNRTHQSLMDQFDEYPDGMVDTLDALEMAVSNAARPKAVLRDKPSWL